MKRQSVLVLVTLLLSTGYIRAGWKIFSDTPLKNARFPQLEKFSRFSQALVGNGGEEGCLSH
jgi:hypothetical protein